MGAKKIAGFDALKKEVKKNIEKQREERIRQIQEAERNQSDHDLFMQALGGVTPLKRSDTVEIKTSAPKPIPQPRMTETSVRGDRYLSDEVGVEHLLEDEETSSYVKAGLGPDILRKLRRGTWQIGDELDLHGMRRDEAREMVVSFLRQANARRIRCVRIIHGKGYGSVNHEPVLKKLVQKWLVQRLDVMAFCEAAPNNGGSGAVVVLLKNREMS